MYIAVGKTWDATQFIASADILDDLKDTIAGHFKHPDAVRFEQYEIWQVDPSLASILPSVTMIETGASFKHYVRWFPVATPVSIPHISIRRELF